MGVNLFLTHGARQCGVKAHGSRFVSAMMEHDRIGEKWAVDEVSTMDHIREAVWYWKPEVTILNFHPGTVPRLEPELNFNLKTKMIALPHEELTLDGAVNFRKRHTQFCAALWQDTTLNPEEAQRHSVFVIPRCIPRFFISRKMDRPDIPEDHVVIKTFGFGWMGKGPEEIVRRVEESFDKATIVGHFPTNELADKDGRLGEIMLQKLRKAVTKPGIQVLRSREMYARSYMSDNDLIQWCADSDINIVMHGEGTGISSTTDIFMAAGIPFAVNDSPFFRHLPREVVLGPKNTLKDILDRGITPWQELAQIKWAPPAFCEGVRKALDSIRFKGR